MLFLKIFIWFPVLAYATDAPPIHYQNTCVGLGNATNGTNKTNLANCCDSSDPTQFKDATSCTAACNPLLCTTTIITAPTPPPGPGPGPHYLQLSQNQDSALNLLAGGAAQQLAPALTDVAPALGGGNPQSSAAQSGGVLNSAPAVVPGTGANGTANNSTSGASSGGASAAGGGAGWVDSVGDSSGVDAFAPSQSAASVQGLSYAGGSGHGGGASGGSSSNSSSKVSGTGSAQSVEMGSVSAVKASLSEDPEDYFTRIGLDESIFKIVHKRYQNKASQWVTSVINPRK